jgi:sugar phosphate permease
METYGLAFYICMGALISQCGILIAFFCILCWMNRPRVAGLNDIESNQRAVQTHWSKRTSNIYPHIEDYILHQQKCS